MKPTDYEFCYRNRRAIVTGSHEGLRVVMRPAKAARRKKGGQ